MKIGLVIYGSLDSISGGYYYDRRLVATLQEWGDEFQVYSQPRRKYAASLVDNLNFRLPAGLDLLIQDELNHPSLLAANQRPHPYPVISLVHHLRTSEDNPGWGSAAQRWIERTYLHSVDGFICNSKTTRQSVRALSKENKPNLVAYPPVDRFQDRNAAGSDP